MNLSYDKDADALYIELRKGDFARNKKIDDLTIVDLNKTGGVLGIEVLGASKRISNRSLSQIQKLITAQIIV